MVCANALGACGLQCAADKSCTKAVDGRAVSSGLCCLFKKHRAEIVYLNLGIATQ